MNNTPIKIPDFRYPETVAKDAQKELDKAIKLRDGHAIVSSLVQISLARTSVSRHNLKDVCEKIDGVLDKKDLLSADIRSLICLLKARLVENAPGDVDNPYKDELRDLWLRAIDPLGNGDVSALQRPLSEYEDLITPGSEWGNRAIPTLLDFVTMRVAEETYFGYEQRQNWLSRHLLDTDIMPRLYIEHYIAHGSLSSWGRYSLDDEDKKLYEKYIDHPECALFLFVNHPEDKDYTLYKDYLIRFPDSPLSDKIQHLVAELEDCSVSLSYANVLQSTDQIKVQAKSRNVNEFTLTLYRLHKTPDTRYSVECPVSDFTPVQTRVIKTDGRVPFEKDDLTVTFDPVSFGQYIVLASYNTPKGFHSDNRLSESNIHAGMINVSDLRTFYIRPEQVVTRGDRDYAFQQPIMIFAVNSQTGKPEADVTVLHSSGRANRSKTVFTDYHTNDEGFVSVEKSYAMSYKLAKGNDKYLPEVSDYLGNSDKTLYRCGLQLLTDLGIYRPGEEIRLSIIAWQASYNQRKPVAEVDLSVELRDAADNIVTTQNVTTDAFGQALANFQIPADRMNGRFKFRVNSVDSEIRLTGYKSVEVSEYKTPTFYIDFSATEQHQQLGEAAKVKGRVMTYSGMPVANAEVECRLTAHPWIWWYDDVNFISRTFMVNTDKEGWFEYLCPAEWTDNENISVARRPYLTYTINATCTNAAGETHEGNIDFWIGNRRGVTCNDETLCLKAGKPADYTVNFLSSDPDEKDVLCHYKLSRITGQDTVVVKEEDFKSESQRFNWDNIPSGLYSIEVYVVGDEEAEVGKALLTLYRESDVLPPVESSLWLPAGSRYMDEAGHIRVLVGTTTGSWIYTIVSGRNHQNYSGWKYYTPGLHWFETDMPKELDEEMYIHFYTIREGQSFSDAVYFRAPWRHEVHLSAVSFRDKITPGNTEHWTFQLTDQDGQPLAGSRMMMELYNEALHGLAPNQWLLNASSFGQVLHSYRAPFYGTSVTRLLYGVPRSAASSFEFILPQENMYGQRFFSPVVKSRIFSRNALSSDMMSVMNEAAPMVMMAKSTTPQMNRMSVAEDVVEEAEDYSAEPALSDVAVRTDEVKVALWLPQLVSDAEGRFSVEFDVPNFNTTYFLQALAYTADLQYDSFRKKVLAQRPLMVQASLPRFLMAGDSIVLSANVMNASDDLLKADAVIELFDPRTKQVVQSQTYQLILQSHDTEVLRINYSVPSDSPYIGFRVKALSADCNGDGEQHLLPINSNIAPIIETRPFYLQPQTQSLGIEVNASSMSMEDRLTFEYCNNPTWYCVTALPSIIDVDAITSTSIAHNLFAIAVTSKLMQEKPKLAEAITSWKMHQNQDGDVLVSALQQNSDLKISPLLASPWLPEAERQTLRMQALDQLFNAERNKRITSQLIASLQKLQAEDGGFKWLDFDGQDHESSYWSTATVLEILGEMHHLGCLPDEAALHTLIEEASHYYDKETLKAEQEMLAAVKKYGGKPSYLNFWSYVYTRQMLLDIAGYQNDSISKGIKTLINKTLKELEKDWGSLSMTSRARAAVTLHRYGRTSKARSIMESVRQFALHHPNKGMYWESLDRYSWFSPVACTSAMLQAFNEVSPCQAEIDEMRQWLLLEKQTSDWGSSSLAIDAVYAILSTGSDWLHASVDSIPQFEILADGKPIVLTDTDRHLGYVRVSLPADTRRVEVSRAGANPAWGSLYHQYKVQMKEVNVQDVDELMIEKQMSYVDADGHAKILAKDDSLHVGDRVRVTLRIHAAKDLEYVTMIDQRPAFMEPVDQTSHYTRSERFFYYLETKDTATKAFIARVPEGYHTISYDCFVTAAGEFTSGIATIQSQYAPQFVAHSRGNGPFLCVK